MKIAILNNLYFPHERGGAEKVAATLAKELLHLDHQVFTISTALKDYRQGNNYYLSSNYLSLAKKNLPYRLIWQINNLYNYSQCQKIKKIFRTERPDLVITNNLMGLGLLIPQMIRQEKIKHIHIIHDLQLLYPSGVIFYNQLKKLDTYLAKKYQTKTRRLFGSPDLIVSPSKWLLDLHCQRNFFPQAKTMVKINPIDHLKAKNLERNPKQFVFIGQVETAKGINFLCSAWKKLPADLKLLIAGSGSQLEKLKAENASFAQIQFLGRLSSQEISVLLAQSSALILPSLIYENSPTVILEAADQDTPTIASCLGGIPELITKYGGATFAPNDEADLLAKIKQHLTSPLKTKTSDEDNYAAGLIEKIIF